MYSMDNKIYIRSLLEDTLSRTRVHLYEMASVTILSFKKEMEERIELLRDHLKEDIDNSFAQMMSVINGMKDKGILK